MPAFKKVNVYTSNEFHDWQRENLPKNFVFQDIDTWALVWADSSKDFEPFAIVELKRSFYEPNAWRPFKADMPNYVALKKLADKAGLPLWIIYFKKGEVIKDNSIFHIFQVNNVSSESEPWITFHIDTLMTARDFKTRFPNIG